MFLPPLGDGAPTLPPGRAKGLFADRELARVQTRFPLRPALHRQDLSILVTSGSEQGTPSFGNERALRLLDRLGHVIHAT